MTPIRELTPDQFWTGSSAALYLLLGLGMLIILLSVYKLQLMLFVASAALLGLLVFLALGRSELLLLCSILAGFIAQARYEQGIQIEEALYGLVYMGYLGYWYVSRIFFYRDRILRSWPDWGIFLFLLYATASLSLTPFLGGDMQAAISQWLSISMLAFYFPIREICLRPVGQNAPKYILSSMGLVAGFIALRNFLDYRRGFQEAQNLWEIAAGRVVMNEHVLMMAGLVSLTFLLFSQRKSHTVALGSLFVVFSTAVVVGQSRALWVSYALGFGILFLLVNRAKRIQIIAVATLWLCTVLLVGFLVFEDFFNLILAGLLDRFFSLQTAATQDVSLINRFLEAKAAWESIKVNPIVGYGFGVPFSYYSLVFEFTRYSSFIHNGYVGVLYRHGVIGFVLLFGFYFGSIWMSLRAVLHRNVSRSNYVLAAAALACLGAESLVANTQNPFATSDYTLIIAVMAALGSAAWERTANGLSDRSS